MKALSMDEYTDFVGFCVEEADPGKARARKLLEERITVPFSFDEACAVPTKSIKEKLGISEGNAT